MKSRACGSTVPGRPSSGEGLFNRTTLDVNNDGTPDQRDTVCADISIWDLALKKNIAYTSSMSIWSNCQF
ncbi:MAG: hypothetical protein IPL98_08195 [Saprospiraceae bacterium]|nr:hypothetical protein [Saprospiraceae bacterium]